jgi:hypothetical protein
MAKFVTSMRTNRSTRRRSAKTKLIPRPQLFTEHPV